MLRPRIIPNLTIKHGELVKTQNFKNWKYIGDPINAVKIFNEKCADEILITDISADNVIKFDQLEEIVSECFMPVCYSGNIRTVEDVSKLMKLGIEKICVRSLAFDKLCEIERIIEKFGTAAVVAVLDLRKTLTGFQLLSSSKAKRTRMELVYQHLQRLIDIGVGEIILNSVNRDGTLKGYDFELFDDFLAECPVPCLISGGCSSDQNIFQAFVKGYDGVIVGRHFVMKPPQDGVLIQYPSEVFFQKVIKERDNQ